MTLKFTANDYLSAVFTFSSYTPPTSKFQEEAALKTPEDEFSPVESLDLYRTCIKNPNQPNVIIKG